MMTSYSIPAPAITLGPAAPISSATVAFIPGVWDLFHVGHLSAIQRAGSMGDYLFVGVQSDALVEAEKGAPPIIPETERLTIVSQLKGVNGGIIYREPGFLDAIKTTGATVLVLSETGHVEARHLAAIAYVESIGGRCVRIPRFPGVSTSEIKSRIREVSERP